jgi:hypothetical protein
MNGLIFEKGEAPVIFPGITKTVVTIDFSGGVDMFGTFKTPGRFNNPGNPGTFRADFLFSRLRSVTNRAVYGKEKPPDFIIIHRQTPPLSVP